MRSRSVCGIFSPARAARGKNWKRPSRCGGGRVGEPPPHLEQEHQPVALALVAMLARQPRQVQVRHGKAQAQLFLRLAAGAGVRRFPRMRMELAAARAPQAEVGLLGALQQQHLVALIEAIEQRRNSVGHYRHVDVSRSGGRVRMQAHHFSFANPCSMLPTFRREMEKCFGPRGPASRALPSPAG